MPQARTLRVVAGPVPSTFTDARRVVTDQHAETADTASLRAPSTAITVGGWCKFPNPGGWGEAYGAALMKGHGTTSPWLSYAIQQGPTADGTFRFRISDGTTNYNTALTTALPTSVWLFLVGYWSSGSKLTLEHWNAAGTLVQTVQSASTVAATIGYTADVLTLGKDTAAGNWLDVDLAGWFVDDVELDAGQIAARRLGPLPTGAAAGAWRASDGVDVAQGNDLSFIGTTLVSGPHDGTGPQLSAVATPTVGATSSTVTWTTSENATSKVEWGTTTSYGSEATASTLVTSHAVNLTGLSASTEYHYRVTSTDTNGNTTVGQDRTFTTGTVSVPGAPSGLTASPFDAQVTLGWDTVADADDYTVYRSTTSGSGFASVASGVAATTYDDTGLTNGVTYYYTVTASNTAGESADSSEVSATPQTVSSWQTAWDTDVEATIRTWFQDNTGIAGAGLTDGDLTASGSIATSSDGQVIDGLLVTGTITVTHDNVTIRNTKITNDGGSRGVYVPYSARNDVNTLTLEYVSIVGTGSPAEYEDAILASYVNGAGTGTGLQCSYVYISGFGKNFRLSNQTGGDRVEYSMVENIQTFSGSHNTGLSFRGGDGKTVYRCWIEGSSSSAISLYPDAPITNFLAEECLLDGGSYSFLGGSGKAFWTSTTGLVTGCKFTRDHTFGPKSGWGGGNANQLWTSNRYLDGEAIP